MSESWTFAVICTVTRKRTRGAREKTGIRLPGVWGLTLAESRTVSLLVNGLTATDIAKVHGRSVHTIRTHLKRAMGKAGVHTQAALVAHF
jgi:DNA-binding CsgD family transcriptional regulator